MVPVGGLQGLQPECEPLHLVVTQLKQQQRDHARLPGQCIGHHRAQHFCGALLLMALCLDVDIEAKSHQQQRTTEVLGAVMAYALSWKTCVVALLLFQLGYDQMEWFAFRLQSLQAANRHQPVELPPHTSTKSPVDTNDCQVRNSITNQYSSLCDAIHPIADPPTFKHRSARAAAHRVCMLHHHALGPAGPVQAL